MDPTFSFRVSAKKAKFFLSLFHDIVLLYTAFLLVGEKIKLIKRFMRQLAKAKSSKLRALLKTCFVSEIVT